MNHVTGRAVNNVGFNRLETVADVVNEGSWIWPEAWYTSFPILSQVNVPCLRQDQVDTLLWKYDGAFYDLACCA